MVAIKALVILALITTLVVFGSGCCCWCSDTEGDYDESYYSSNVPIDNYADNTNSAEAPASGFAKDTSIK